MPNAARLSGLGTFYAFEFDDNTNSSFSVSVGSTAFSNEFDENTSTTLSGTQRMSATSSGGVIVLDSINEIDPFGEISTDGLQLHLDSVDSGITTTSGGGASSAAFNFRYHAYGSDTGSTTVYWYNTTTSTLNTLTTISGQQHTSNADEWDAYSLDLSSYSGETGRIVIRYATGGAGNTNVGFNQDPALDEMELVDTTSGTINLDPSNTQPNGGWEQQGGSSSTYPTSGYSALTTNQEDPGDYWQYDTNGTPTTSSGPDQDFNNNGTTIPDGYYIYFEGSSPNNQTGVYGWLQTSSTYTLNTGSTTNYHWEDLSGNNRDATFKNVAADPTSGNFINFDGTDDYAACDGAGTGASSYLGIDGTGARTSIVFFKLDSNTITAQNRLLAWGLPGTNGAKWSMELSTTNQINIGVSGGSRRTNTTYDFSKWNMIAATYPGGVGDTTDIRIWVNGIEQTDLAGTTQTVDTDTTTNSTGYVSVGAAVLPDPPNGFVDGLFAKAMIYNRALSDLEIKIIYRSILRRLVG